MFPASMALVVLLSGDSPIAVRVLGLPAFGASVWFFIALSRQHVLAHAGGITTRRAIRSETTPWAEITSISFRRRMTIDGRRGWAYVVTLRDGRTAPRETFGEVLLRERDRDRLKQWIVRHAPDVRVTIAEVGPYQRRRRPPTPPPLPDPAETIRSIRHAEVGRYLVKVTGVDGGFVAIVRLADGSEIERGPIREAYRDALDDGSLLVERYRSER